MTKRYFPVVIALCTLFFTSCGSSRRSVGVEEGWELLSEQKVNSRNQYTAIRFKVEDKDVRINDLKIYFRNGDKLEPSLDEVIPANQMSRIIELAREGRDIDKIEFKYRTTGSFLSGRANVLVFGKKYSLYGY
jgi:hypothetical protein